MEIFKNLVAERVFHYFFEISKIPRESKNEKAIREYLKKFAQENNLDYYQDKIGNLIIKKEASKNFENSNGIILQGHLDMVCEKSEDSSHNFETDPLDLIIEDNFIKAKGTTLGADNGIAIAMAMAILENKELRHPNIEFLATIEEETSMKGAMNLEKNILKGKYLINLDAKEEDVITVASAGALIIENSVKIEKEKINKGNYKFFNISISNLLGGHSGREIHKKRGNAYKILLDIISKLREEFEINLIDIKGSSKVNVIPKESSIDFTILKQDESKFLKKVKDIFFNYKKLLEIEKNVEFKVKEIEVSDEIIPKKYFNDLLKLSQKLPNGVNTFMKNYPEIVESSSNFAAIKIENNKIKLIVSIRSSNKEEEDKLAKKIYKLANNYSYCSEILVHFPAWEYMENSKIRDTSLKTYEQLFDKKMKIAIVHTGLECGALKKNYPNLEIISLGPDIYDIHSVKERLDITSTERTYTFLLELLKNLKDF